MSKEPASAEPQKDRKTAATTPIWLGFAEKYPTSRGTMRVRLKWGRIGAFMAVMAVMAWMGKSVAFFYFFSQVRDFEEVKFVDMIAFPFNRSAIRVQQGDYQIDQGLEAMEREDYQRAFRLLREGVTRSPENLEGRLTLARIYAGWRPDLAIEVMTDRLELGKDDPDYIRLLTALLIREKKDALLLEITEDLLATDDLPQEIQRVASAARLNVAIARGRFDIAEEVYRTTDIKDTLDCILLGADLYTRIEQPETAVTLLQSVLNAFPDQNLQAVYRKLIQVYRDTGDLRRAREVALEYSIQDPMEWRPRILLVDLLDESGLDERRDREVAAILRQHRNDEQAMMALGQICANQGNEETASRLYELALENDFNLGIFSLILIESYVNAGSFENAIELSNELVRESPDWLTDLESTFNGIRSLAYYGIGNRELGSLYLKNFRESRRTTVGQLYQASRSFVKNGLEDEALTLLLEAFERDGTNEQVLADLIDLQMNLGNSYELAEHIQELIDLRRPSYDLIGSISQRLTSDRFIYTADRQDLLVNLNGISDEPKGIELVIWEPRSVEEVDKKNDTDIES